MSVESEMLPLATEAPDFALPDVVSGDTVKLTDFLEARALLVMFICRHCPYVRHVRPALAQLGRDNQDTGLAIVAISANDPETYPEDAPESLAEEAREAGYTFPYLFDETQDIARAYHAACTPDFFLFDGDRRLVYRGQLDDSRPGNGKPNDGADLRAALDAVLAGKTPSPQQVPSMGCNIKWKPGNEPAY